MVDGTMADDRSGTFRSARRPRPRSYRGRRVRTIGDGLDRASDAVGPLSDALRPAMIGAFLLDVLEGSSHGHRQPISRWAWLAAAVATIGGPALGADDRPNVVLIVADDLGWADLGCYGSKFHRTPNLDRLAEGGRRFTQAYAASPVCSPTRVALMTGKHPARLNLTDWLPGQPDLPAVQQAQPAQRFDGAAARRGHDRRAASRAPATRPATSASGTSEASASGRREQGFDVNIAGSEIGTTAEQGVASFCWGNSTMAGP